MITKISLCLSLSIFVLAYNSIGFADDGLTPGPGLFSGETGGFSLGSLLNRQTTPAPSTIMESGKTLPPKVIAQALANGKSVEHSAVEFNAYLDWRNQQSDQTEAYQDFLLWIEYQNQLSSQSEQ